MAFALLCLPACDRNLIGHLLQQAAAPGPPPAGITLQRLCDALTATVLPASDVTVGAPYSISLAAC